MSETSNNFWRSKLTWRSTNTGMNENVIGKLTPFKGKREFYTYAVDYHRCLSHEERQKIKSFVDTVNGCISDVYSEGKGYVFTEEQLCAVKSVLRVKVRRDCGNQCYVCTR